MRFEEMIDYLLVRYFVHSCVVLCSSHMLNLCAVLALYYFGSFSLYPSVDSKATLLLSVAIFSLNLSLALHSNLLLKLSSVMLYMFLHT